MPEYFGIVFAVAVVGFFVTAIVLAVRREKQRIAEKIRILGSLGYQVLDPVDPAFSERVSRLHRRWGHENYRIRFCAVRKSWEHSAYVFDLWRSGKNSRLAGENTIVFVSPKLKLPRFSLFPRVKLPGFVSGLIDSLTEKFLAERGGRVELSGNPAMSEQFIVAGKEHDAIRAVLSGQVLDYLASINPARIEADGDLVMISKAEFERKTIRQSPESIEKTVAEGTALFEFLIGH